MEIKHMTCYVHKLQYLSSGIFLSNFFSIKADIIILTKTVIGNNGFVPTLLTNVIKLLRKMVLRATETANDGNF